jgi:hypothetical protein
MQTSSCANVLPAEPFCEIASLVLTSKPSPLKGPSEWAVGNGDAIKKHLAVLALVKGMDAERIFPLVESLRATGSSPTAPLSQNSDAVDAVEIAYTVFQRADGVSRFNGSLHLLSTDPEAPSISSCAQGSAWCRRLAAFLVARGVTLHDFPPHIVAARQHLHLHDALLRLQLLGYGAERLRAAGATNVVATDASDVLFQSDPFGVLDLTHSLHLLSAPDSARLPGAEYCGRAAGFGEVFWDSAESKVLSGGLVAGTPEAVTAHAARQLLLALRAVLAAGAACCLAPEVFATWVHANGPVAGVKVHPDGGIAGKPAVGVRLLDHAARCSLAEESTPRPCAIDVSRPLPRSKCLNLGCCFLADGRCLRPAEISEATAYHVRNGTVLAKNGEAIVAVVLAFSEDREVAARSIHILNCEGYRSIHAELRCSR